MPFTAPRVLIDVGDGTLVVPLATTVPPSVADPAPIAGPSGQAPTTSPDDVPVTTAPGTPIPQPGRPLIDVGDGTVIPARPVVPPARIVPVVAPPALVPLVATPAPPPTLTGQPIPRPGRPIIDVGDGSFVQASDVPVSPSRRTLADISLPQDDEGLTSTESKPIPDWVQDLNKALEATHYGEAPNNVSEAFHAWVERNWLGAPFTPAQLQRAFSLARTEIQYPPPFGKADAENFRRTNPPGAFNPFEFVVFSGDDARDLLRRAYAIHKDLGASSRDARARLEGAQSATGLVLAIVSRDAALLIPWAGRYVGAGPPAGSLQAALQDVLRSTGKATKPSGAPDVPEHGG